MGYNPEDNVLITNRENLSEKCGHRQKENSWQPRTMESPLNLNDN